MPLLRRILITTTLLSSPLSFSYTTLINNSSISLDSEFKSLKTPVFSCSRTFFSFNKVNFSKENICSQPFTSKMAWYCSAGSNDDLVNNLKAAKIIKSERVEKAMKAVDRKHYASQTPYKDSPQPLGYGATISAP
jgi:hypothetical protein